MIVEQIFILIIISSMLFLAPYFSMKSLSEYKGKNSKLMELIKKFNNPRWPGKTKSWELFKKSVEHEFEDIKKIAQANNNLLDYEFVQTSSDRNYDANTIIDTVELGGYFVTLSPSEKQKSESFCIVTHLDSHALTNGTSDNLVAVAQSLMLLNYFASYRNLTYSLTSIFTESEEQSLNSIYGMISHPTMLNCELFIVLEAMGCASSYPIITSAIHSSNLITIFQNVPQPTFRGNNLIMDITKLTRGKSTTESMVIGNKEYGVCKYRNCTQDGIPLLEIVYANEPYKYHTIHDNYECLSENSVSARYNMVKEGIIKLQNPQNFELLKHNEGSEYYIALSSISFTFTPYYLLIIMTISFIQIIYFYIKINQSIFIVMKGFLLVCFIAAIFFIGTFSIYYVSFTFDPLISQRADNFMNLYILILPPIFVFSVANHFMFKFKELSNTLYPSFLLIFNLMGSLLYYYKFHVSGVFIITSFLCGIFYYSCQQSKDKLYFYFSLLVGLNYYLHFDNIITLISPLSVQYSRDRVFLSFYVLTIASFMIYFPFFISFLYYNHIKNERNYAFLSLSSILYTILIAYVNKLPAFTPNHPLGVQIALIEVELPYLHTMERTILISASNPVYNKELIPFLEEFKNNTNYKYEKINKCYFSFPDEGCYRISTKFALRIVPYPKLTLPEIDVVKQGKNFNLTIYQHNDEYSTFGAMVTYINIFSESDFSYNYNGTEIKTGTTRSFKSIMAWTTKYNINNIIINPLNNTQITYQVLCVLRTHEEVTKYILSNLGPNIAEFSKSSYVGPQTIGVEDVIEI